MQASILRHNVYGRSLCDRTADGSPSEPSAQRTGENDSSQGGERAAYVALETSSVEGMRDRPPCREAQGDGAAVVLSARESRVQGEGRQVSAVQRQGGRREAKGHNCPRTNRPNGGQALERRIRRKVYVRCGEGPTEKERATATSPAAYSTRSWSGTAGGGQPEPDRLNLSMLADENICSLGGCDPLPDSGA